MMSTLQGEERIEMDWDWQEQKELKLSIGNLKKSVFASIAAAFIFETHETKGLGYTENKN